ncbi:MAG: hypothetical protein A2408_04200 [Candidatus Yonathbacteria bacterium RIFOXYC1_FULL_52_10]|uniref:Membrane fusion protein biotin-lipoyl like domain-containing protein n=1 Tax=Candidatus Yonathbacteria bacterium RIFOXYD1_FULL_52_36 TaxID=1802730 RepID=A0A1G2SN84_9BACT|nr:MAG: hypothetical protein A2408_04200 [Candidatus Yonathbacteria bacterium RIFOXYC1_FULL_52_10]OHA86414.1 MAG: hypothetical protein A2591_03120 [Candidatus Yonathbacteria bacterium RIFOXYD1_FULL_52_36]
MNQRFATALSFGKRHTKLLIGIALVIIAGGFWISMRGGSDTEPGNVFVVENTTLTQEVSVTGSVKAASTANLSFEKSGRVSRVYAREGAAVVPGQILAAIANADLAAEVLAAEADVAREKATLAELLRGARDEDIRVKEAELSSAEQTLKNYYSDIRETLEDAYVTVDDATRTKLSGIYRFENTSYKLSFSACSAQDEIDAAWKRYLVDTELSLWKTEINTLEGADDAAKETVLRKAQGHIDAARALLETTAAILTANCTITNTALDTYRTSVSTARTNVSTEAGSIADLSQSLSTQKLVIEQRRRELELKKAPATTESVDAARAALARTEARLAAARVELGKTEVRSPIYGTITKMEVEAGELMTLGTPIATVMSSKQFEIEANVPEADIAKLAINNTAKVTLDAYGDDEVFAARLYFIDPAETVIDGVPTYRVKIQFAENDPRIKSGMTANVTLLALKKENVLSVPQRAITQEGSTKTVRIIAADGTTTSREITTGIRGSDGKVEVLSGLNGGETIDLSTD